MVSLRFEESKNTMWATTRGNGLIHNCYQAVIQSIWGELFMLANDWAITGITHALYFLFYTRASTSLWLHTAAQSTPLSVSTPHLCLTSLIHLCSLLPYSQEAHLWYSPLAPSLTLCRLRITMKDKVLMISIQFSLRVREYTSWINPKIYDINILSSSKRKRAAGMDGECHAGATTTFTNPLAPLPAHITDGNHWRIITANQLRSV